MTLGQFPQEKGYNREDHRQKASFSEVKISYYAQHKAAAIRITIIPRPNERYPKTKSALTLSFAPIGLLKPVLFTIYGLNAEEMCVPSKLMGRFAVTEKSK